MVQLKINAAVSFSANWGIEVHECAVDMEPVELHQAICLAFRHLQDKHLLEACCGGENLLNKSAGIGSLSYDEYLSICKKIDIQRATSTAKKSFTRKRRSQFSSAQPRLVLAMIESGISYTCNHKSCHATTDLTIDHIVPLSRGGSDELGNLQFLCRTHNSLKSDQILGITSVR